MDNKLSKEEQLQVDAVKVINKQIEKKLANVKASFAMENLYVTEEETEIGRQLLKGEITEEEALKKILRV